MRDAPKRTATTPAWVQVSVASSRRGRIATPPSSWSIWPSSLAANTGFCNLGKCL